MLETTRHDSSVRLTGFVAEGLGHPQLRPELDVVLLLRNLDRLLQSLPDVQGALLVDEAEMRSCIPSPSD